MRPQSPATQERAATASTLFQATVARLVPDPDDAQLRVISTYGQALTDRVDRQRSAIDSRAVGFETLSATATALFGAALAELGFSPTYIAPHGAAYGVEVRGIVMGNNPKAKTP